MPVKSVDDFASINIQKIIRLMETQGVATRSDLVGVSEKEIKQLERHFELAFPKAYRQYLRSFGRSAGFLSPWMAVYFDDLKEIRDTFEQYLAQGFKYKLPVNALLIANFENTFDFMICNGAPDPQVQRVDFRCEKPRAKKFAPSFSLYLEKLVKNSNDACLPPEPQEYEELEVIEDVINY